MDPVSALKAVLAILSHAGMLVDVARKASEKIAQAQAEGRQITRAELLEGAGRSQKAIDELEQLIADEEDEQP